MTTAIAKSRNGVPAEVPALLTLWGNYHRRDLTPGELPKQSAFVIAALYGKLGIPQESNVRQDNAMPALVEWMDKIVERMPEDLRAVIETQYRPALNRIGHEPTPEAKAKSMGYSPSTFRNRLESAQWYVFARMYS